MTCFSCAARDGLSILKACSYIFYQNINMCLRVASEVTLLEIPPCQTPMCGVAYSCSYVLLPLCLVHHVHTQPLAIAIDDPDPAQLVRRPCTCSSPSSPKIHDRDFSSGVAKERLSNSFAFDSFVRKQTSVSESKKKKKKRSTIESEYLLSGSSGTSKNRVTGYSMYSFQP